VLDNIFNKRKKKNKIKKILHLVVGFGIYEYFINCINSIIRFDKSSDILILVTGNPKLFGWSYNNNLFDKQSDEFLRIKNFVKNIRVKNKIIIKKINLISIKNNFFCKKTGLLYKAYNFGLRFSLNNKYDYLNIIQNDMQLLFWNKRLISLIDELFSKNKNSFHIFTGFPRKGSTADFYDRNDLSKRQLYLETLKKKKYIFFHKHGIGDWGVLNLKRVKKINFSFEKNENFMSNKYKIRGFETLLLPTPFVVVIPWPAVIRKQKIIGSIHELNKNNLLLKCTTTNPYRKLILCKEKLWQEDWAKPNGWYAFYPCCYTDFKILEYFRSFMMYKKKKHDFFFRYVSSKDDKSFFINFTFKKIYPKFWLLFLSYFYNKTLTLVKNVINFNFLRNNPIIK